MTISVEGVKAGYVPGVNILNGVDVDVEEGDIVTVIGPNGSGKSTLLKTVMGYLRPSEGSVAIDGSVVDDEPVHRRATRFGVAYVPQVDNVFRPLTVRENLEVGGQHLDRRRRKDRISELMDAYPVLGDKARSRADSLSGGQRQVLAIARALMTSPRHLLLDEPSAGLAPALVDQVFNAISDISRREGVSILLVEQNAAQALEVSDRAYVFVVGRVVMSGPARQVLDDDEVRHLYLGGAPQQEVTSKGPRGKET
jgi:branched-chain amino acid transport system ATP-binding protein